MDRPAIPDRAAHYCASAAGGFCAHEHATADEAVACARRLFAGLPWRVVRLEDTGIGAQTTLEQPEGADFARMVREVGRRIK